MSPACTPVIDVSAVALLLLLVVAGVVMCMIGHRMVSNCAGWLSASEDAGAVSGSAISCLSILCTPPGHQSAWWLLVNAFEPKRSPLAWLVTLLPCDSLEHAR